MNDNEFTGTVKIKVGDGGSSDGDIEYSVDADDNVTFKKADFNSYCKRKERCRTKIFEV